MKLFQVSTLQALMLGYTRSVIPVSELLGHGNIGLGTFTDVDGEMIVLDGTCYRAMENGDIAVAEPDRGVPFSVVCSDRRCGRGGSDRCTPAGWPPAV